MRKIGNTFEIISNKMITVMVNRYMVDPSKPIKIFHNGTTAIEGVMKPSK